MVLPITRQWIVLTLAALTGCAPESRYPPFRGVETELWIAYEVQLSGREPSDLLLAFQAAARRYGCMTERIGGGTQQVIIGGELRFFFGVNASCDKGNIALISLVGGRVRIGCTQPTTRERCDLMLQEISEGGR
jgi:hypothetical protein